MSTSEDEAFDFLESLTRTRRDRDEEDARRTRIEGLTRKRRLEHPAHPEVRTDRAVGFARGDAMFCNHANEVPSVCPCDADCYCKTRTCKYGSPGAPEPGRLQLGRDVERMETGRARVATPPMQSSAERSPGRLVPRFVEQTTRVAYTESPQVYPSIDETLESMGDYETFERKVHESWLANQPRVWPTAAQREEQDTLDRGMMRPEVGTIGGAYGGFGGGFGVAWWRNRLADLGDSPFAEMRRSDEREQEQMVHALIVRLRDKAFLYSADPILEEAADALERLLRK